MCLPARGAGGGAAAAGGPPPALGARLCPRSERGARQPLCARARSRRGAGRAGDADGRPGSRLPSAARGRGCHGPAPVLL